MTTGTGGDRDKPVGAFAYGRVRMAIVDHVM